MHARKPSFAKGDFPWQPVDLLRTPRYGLTNRRKHHKVAVVAIFVSDASAWTSANAQLRPEPSPTPPL